MFESLVRERTSAKKARHCSLLFNTFCGCSGITVEKKYVVQRSTAAGLSGRCSRNNSSKRLESAALFSSLYSMYVSGITVQARKEQTLKLPFHSLLFIAFLVDMFWNNSSKGKNKLSESAAYFLFALNAYSGIAVQEEHSNLLAVLSSLLILFLVDVLEYASSEEQMKSTEHSLLFTF
ncbi:hypothetical protein AVEN_202510-1 [Araneus ventricosus]|uniref:Uncharacterized protein n=1 Tax=Araneus ventricosus TaxID=182803 RepID=A0A4Y2WYJ7_ARAVE|nr:hypothetical protein AVEN_202510-1 [Araneus ventricosus]